MEDVNLQKEGLRIRGLILRGGGKDQALWTKKICLGNCFQWGNRKTRGKERI